MTERVGVIARVRALAVGIAKAWVDQQKSDRLRRVTRPTRKNLSREKRAKKQKLVAGWIVNLVM